MQEPPGDRGRGADAAAAGLRAGRRGGGKRADPASIADPYRRELAELLGGLFRATGKTQRAVADLVFVVESRISETLNGVGAPPSLDLVRGISKALNATKERQRRAEDLVGLFGSPAQWVLGGDEPRDHVAMRAAGHRPGDKRSGDLFTGRSVAVDRVRGWLTAATGPGTPLVVTGQPGAGKSSVVARAARDLETSGIHGGLFFHARGCTRNELLAAVQTLAGDPTITDTEGWLSHLRGRTAGGQPPMLVVVDALDEAISGSEIVRISQLLTTVAAEPALRIVVATRRGRGNQLLRHLGIPDDDAANLVDLDIDTYFDPADLRRVASGHLTQAADDDYPGRAQGAWVRYRADPALTDRLAAVVARRADRNFLVAAFAAHSLSTMREVLDPAALGFDNTLIPSSVAEAFTKYFDTIPDERQRFRTGRLLTALAFAQGPGLDDDTWLLFGDALGLAASREDVQLLRRSPVADYLLETEPDEHGLGVRTRLYHQALVDQLLSDCDPDDGHRIFQRLTPSDPDGWTTAGTYIRRYLVDHAASVGQLLTLLQQPSYLAVADLTRLLPALPSRPTGELQAIASILRTCVRRAARLDQLERTLLFAQAAAHLGLVSWQYLFNQKSVALEGPTLLWAHSRIITTEQRLAPHDGPVTAVAVGRLGDNGDVIITSSSDRTARVWDRNGQLIKTLVGDFPVSAVAIGRLGDHGDVIVTCSPDRTRIWDSSFRPINHQIPEVGGEAAVIGPLGNHGDVIVTSGSDQTRVWGSDCQSIPIGTVLHEAGSAVAIGRLGDHGDVFATSLLGAVVIHNSNGDLINTIRTFAREVRVGTVAIGRLGDHGDVVIIGDSGATRVWDRNGQLINTLDGEAGPVAIGPFGDHGDVIIAGSTTKTARIWDSNGQLISALTHDQNVRAIAIGPLGSHGDVIVTASSDRTQIWYEFDQPLANHLVGHDLPITSMGAGSFGNHGDVIVTGSSDRTARIWDSNGKLMQTLTGDFPVRAVAIGHLGVHGDVIIIVGTDGVEVWDSDFQIIDTLIPEIGTEAVAIGPLGHHGDVIIVGSSTGAVQMWDSNGHLIYTLAHKDRGVEMLATGRLGSHGDVIVACSSTGAVRMWDSNGQLIDTVLHDDGLVSAVAIGPFGDQGDVIVTGSFEGDARIWDSNGQLVETIAGKHPVRTVAVGQLGDHGDVVVVGTGGSVRVRHRGVLRHTRLPSLSPILAFSTRESMLYMATGPAIVAWRFS